MKKTLLSIILLFSIGVNGEANASIDKIKEILVCDQCNESNMENVAQTYGFLNVTAGSEIVMVYSLSDGMFREFVVTPTSLDRLESIGSSSNAQMKPLRYNQDQVENNLRAAFEEAQNLRTEVNGFKGEIFNFGSSDIFGSAADALRKPLEAANRVTDYLSRLSTFSRYQIEQQNAMNLTDFSLTFQTRIANIQNNFAKGAVTTTIGIVGFEDGTTWWVELEFVFVGGISYLTAKPTSMAYFAGRFAGIPISEDGVKFTEDVLQLKSGLADLSRLFRYYDSLAGVTSNEIKVDQASIGSGACYTTTYSDGSTSQEYCELDSDYD